MLAHFATVFRPNQSLAIECSSAGMELAVRARTELEGDPRLQAPVEAVRSLSYRGELSDLPSYAAAETGEM